MAAMSESFVDLSYRGLALAKRIKLTQIRPQSGYLELPTPMPVGTTIGIATDEGVLLEATVTEVHEQVGGSDRTPGMLVRPNLGVAANEAWWSERAERPSKAAPPPDADGKVTVKSPRMTGEAAVPELMDDGHDTGVMDAVDLSADNPDAVIADLPHDTQPSRPALPRDASRRAHAHDTITTPISGTGAAPPEATPTPLDDDGKRTMAMDAVDLAALGLTASSSGEMPAVKPEDYADDGANTGETPAAPEKSDGGGKAKKKRKRR